MNKKNKNLKNQWHNANEETTTKAIANLRKFNASKYEYDGNFFLQHDTARCRRITKVEVFLNTYYWSLTVYSSPSRIFFNVPLINFPALV